MMKKRIPQKGIVAVILGMLFLLAALAFLTGCGGDGKITDFAAKYSNGSVKFSWAANGADEVKVYKAYSPDDAPALAATVKKNEYTASDAYAYFQFKSYKGGKEVSSTKPFSYVRSYFGDRTKVFTPDDDQKEIQSFINEYYSVSSWDQQGTDRLSMLFMPGEYNAVDMHIGYYTSVSGLGYDPSDVSLKALHTFDHPTNKEGTGKINTALSNFWRSIENVTLNSNSLWSVCQATSFRRVHAKGNLELAGYSWSSGGYIADCRIDGTVYARSQQQWFTRNTTLGTWNGVNINMVFAGVNGKLPAAWSAANNKNTVLSETEEVRDKPYIVFDESLGYGVFVPDIRYNAAGHSWRDESTPGQFVSIDKFYVADSTRDNAGTINAALANGKHLIFSPGVYELDSAIEVKRADTIVMGMGYATLQLTDKNTDAALRTSDQSGINVSSLLFKSGLQSDYLLVVGEEGASRDHASNPICLSDLFFCSIALKYDTTDVDTTMVIHSSDVLGDHFWLWRADHGFDPADRTMRTSWSADWNYDNKLWKWEYTGTLLFDANGVWREKSAGGWDGNRGRVGLIVNGDDVSIYGLFVEHYQEYQTIWNGENGFMCFYQCETPYEMTTQNQWMRDGGSAQADQGWAGYKIAANVQNHVAHGIGIYMVKRDTTNQVMLDHSIEAPSNPGIKLYHMITSKLGTSHPQDGIRYIINDKGTTVTSAANRAGFTSFVGGVYTAN